MAVYANSSALPPAIRAFKEWWQFLQAHPSWLLPRGSWKSVCGSCALERSARTYQAVLAQAQPGVSMPACVSSTPCLRSPERCLTLRSSGPPPARRLGREAFMFIIRLAAKPPRRWCPLSSNVRPHMHTAAAWVVGFVAMITVALLLGLAGDAIGVPPLIFHDTPIGREIDGEYIESSSSATSFGLATMLFSWVVAVWAGRAVYAKSWGAGFTPVARLTFFAWLIGTAVLVVAGAVVDMAFQRRNGSIVFYARLLLELGIAAGVAWACHQWWKNRVARLQNRE